MFHYDAPNPYPKSAFHFLGSFFKSIFSSTSVGELIVPAQSREKNTIQEQRIAALETRFNVSTERGYVTTHDGAQLETFEIKPKKETSRYIIKFNGNGTFYSDCLESFAKDADRLNATVIGFNYRGVNHSTLNPAAYKELLIDGISQVMRLLDQGVSPDLILLDGHSLGGSIATMVAKYFYDKNQEVYLWNDRSFSTLAKAAAGMFAGDSFEDCSAVCTYTSLAPGQWNVNVAAAYNALPADKKGYACAEEDRVISHKASLHEAVKGFEKQRGYCTGFLVQHRMGLNGHNAHREDLYSVDNPSQTEQQLYESFVNSHMKSHTFSINLS